MRSALALLHVLLILVASLGATPAQAQVLPAASDTAAGEAAGAPAPESSTQALIDLLKDDAARQDLIARLEAGIAGTGPDATAEEPPAEEPRTLGRQISVVASEVAEEIADRSEVYWMQVRRLPDRVSDFIDVLDYDILVTALTGLGFVVLTTYSAYFLLRAALRRLSRRLERAAAGHGYLRRLFIGVSSAVLDALVVALSVVLSTLAAIRISGAEDYSIGPLQVNYLTAFYMVGWTFVALRAILAPRFPQLRLIPLSDYAAQTIWRWLTVCVAVLGYGQIVVVPLVQREAGYLPAFATSSVIGGSVVLYSMWFVWRHRGEVALWLEGGREEQAGRIARGLAEHWHVPVLLYGLFLFAIALLRPGNVLLPILLTSGKVAALVIGWVFLRNFLRRLAHRGARLPAAMAEAMPGLERRLNTVLPTIVLFLRAVLAVGVIGGVLTILGAIDPATWFGDDSREGLVEGLLTITLIIGVAAAVWLALASWVDFRLNPYVGKPASPRETTLLTLLFNASTIGLVIITLMLVLSEAGVNIAPLLASAGVLGLAIGFGAQKMVQDIITGIFIQFENAINVGDVVTVAGTTGVVEKLTVRSVSLRDLHGAFHIIPFSSVDMVSNYMRDFAYSVCDMGVAYREDIEEARQAMFDAFEELKRDEEQASKILGDMEWFGLNSFGDSAIVLRSRIKTLPGQQWGVGRAYNLILKRIFDERGIEIPFPHQTIYFGEDRKGNAPPLHIKAETVTRRVETPRKPLPETVSSVPDDEAPGEDND